MANNRISTLNGSMSNLRYLEVLFLNNNKLRNLDKILETLKELIYLKNLNLFDNYVAEEPEYRSRVIYALSSLEIFDRHSIIILTRNN